MKKYVLIVAVLFFGIGGLAGTVLTATTYHSRAVAQVPVVQVPATAGCVLPSTEQRLATAERRLAADENLMAKMLLAGLPEVAGCLRPRRCRP